MVSSMSSPSLTLPRPRIADFPSGIISNYPARVGYVAREMGYSVHLKKPLDAIHSEHDCLRGKTLPPAYQTPTSNPAPEL